MTTFYHFWGDIIDNAAVSGLYEAVRASKYPAAVDTAACNDDVTETVKRLEKAPIGSGHNNYLGGTA